MGLVFLMHAGIVPVVPDAGLPDKCITSITRDKKGLMWMGTKSGLCLYDGYGFLPVFSGHPLSTTVIQKLVYDRESGLIWAATEKGLYKINGESLEAKLIGGPNKWSSNPVTDLIQHTNGHIFASYKSAELLELTPDGTVIAAVSIKAARQLATYPISLSKKDKEVIVSLAGINEAFLFNPANRKISKEKEGIPLIGMDIDRKTFSLHTGDTTIVYPHHLVGRDWDNFKKAMEQPQNIKSILFPAKDIAYIICRPCIVYKLDCRKMSLEQIMDSDFNGRLITSIFLDPQQIMWLGTNKGLLKMTYEQSRFEQHFLLDQPVSIRSLVADDHNHMYAGTYSGIFKKDTSGNNWIKIGNQIPFSMINVPGKYIYFVEEQLKLYRIEKKTGAITSDFYTRHLPSESSINKGYSLELDQKGKIWAGTNSGLAQFDPEAGTLSPLVVNGLSLKGITVRNVRITDSGRVLLCTDNGFYDLDTRSGKTTHLHTRSQPALSSNIINYATVDPYGRLWLCTEGGGLNIWSKDRKTISLLKAPDGLSDNTTYHLIWKYDYAFISTYTGLSTYNLKEKTFYNFFATDGLTENECNRNAFLEDKSGKLYLGTINGISSFYARQLMQSSSSSALLASVVSKWDNGLHAYVNLPPSGAAKQIIMGPWDHSLTINLALTDYTSPERTVFSYRVKGLFDEWINMYNQHSIQLNGLSPGKYVVEARALDAHGQATANILNYHIVVQQAFFRSVWFYLLSCLVVLGVVGYVFRIRLNKLKEVQGLRQQISSDLHDEVGSLLTRITMTSDHMRYTGQTPDDKTAYLNKISGLSRKAVSSMNDILWAIDTRNDFTENLSDRLREYAEEALAALSVEIIFDIQVAQKKPIPSQTRQELYMIFKEAINNISKHSTPSLVTIAYHYTNQQLFLAITNNGSPAPVQSAHKGQGLKNIRMRAERLGAAAEIKQSGALFTVAVSRKLR